MEKFFIDENGEYGLDCSKVVWAADQMHLNIKEWNEDCYRWVLKRLAKKICGFLRDNPRMSIKELAEMTDFQREEMRR